MDLRLVINSDGQTTNLNIDSLQIQKMIFIYNALEDGWKIKKEDKSYIFKKNHEEKKEYFSDSYLQEFINTHIDILNIQHSK